MSFLFRAAFYVFLNRLLPTSLVSVIQKSHQLHKRRGVKREFSVNFSSCSPVLFVERIRRTKGSTENPRAFYNGLSSFPMLREMRERSSVRREPMMFVEEAGQTGKKRFAVYWCAICQPNYPDAPTIIIVQYFLNLWAFRVWPFCVERKIFYYISFIFREFCTCPVNGHLFVSYIAQSSVRIDRIEDNGMLSRNRRFATECLSLEEDDCSFKRIKICVN